MTKDEYENTTDRWYKPGGCREKLIKCQTQAKEEDPDWQGNVPSVIKCFKDFDSSCLTVEDMSRLPKERNVHLIRVWLHVFILLTDHSLDGMTLLIPSQIQLPNLV